MANVTLLRGNALQYILDQISTSVSAEANARSTAIDRQRLALRDTGILNLINIGGTGNAITADLHLTLENAGITTLSGASEVEYIPLATNSAANPTITIGSQTFSIRNSDGGTWPAEGFVVGRSYKLRRRNNVLRVGSGDIAISDLTGLSAALSSRRVASIWIVNFSGTTFPSGTDTVIQRQNNSFSIWVSAGSQPDPLDPAVHQQDATGQWWIRVWSSGAADQALATEISRAIAAENALLSEMRNGRVYYLTWTANPSGSNIPDWADFVVVDTVSSGRITWWRKREAPSDGQETDNIKRDANGQWWNITRDADAAQERADRIADVSDLRTEVRNGRAYYQSAAETPSGQDIPSYADFVTTGHNASGTTRDWRLRGAPEDGHETENVKLDANGRWWTRMRDAAVGNAIRDGGIITTVNIGGTGDAITADIAPAFIEAGITSLGGASEIEYIPTASNTANNPTLMIGGQTFGIRNTDGSTWPADGFVVGRSYKLRRRGGNLRVANGDATSVELAALSFLIGGKADIANSGKVFATREGAENAGQENLVPALGRVATFEGDWINVRGPNSGNDPLFEGYPSWGIVDRIPTFRVIDALFAELDARVARTEYQATIGDLADQIALPSDDDWPGNDAAVVARAENGIAVAVDGDGNLRGTLLSGASDWPGNWLTEEKVDLNGVVIEGHDIRDGSKYTTPLGSSDLPGNWVIPLVEDLDGVTVLGVDKRTGDIYGLPEGGGGGGDDDGSRVKFVDPEYPGEVFGAVEDADGVIKFTTILPPGIPFGMEKRNGHFFADTQSLAIAALAIGGGDTGLASSIEEYRWHVFDETLEPQDMGTAASGLVSAILAKQKQEYKARSLMFPIAEVIGSTVEADVLAGAPRRAQLMERLQTAVDNAAILGKTLMVGWIKLDLLSGAPATPFATAREHYGMVGNGLRLEAAEVTGQGGAPLLIVNQSFGTRADGTPEVILAEGRLDWDFYSIGFVVPTPLYPFDLVEGTLATLTPEALLIVREIEALALAEIERGGEWFCPSLEEATLDGTTITARFATLSPLVLRDPENHGFSFAQAEAPAITDVSVSGSYATITLTTAPNGPLTLQYAFGQTGDPGDGRPANRGSLTDDWEQESTVSPGTILHRHARSGRATAQ